MQLRLFSWLIIPLFVMIFIGGYLVRNLKNESKLEGFKSVNESQDLDRQSVKGQLISEFKYEGSGVVTIWFDDAWSSQYEVAYPILKRRGIKAALSVPTLALGKEGYMNWWNVEKLQFDGWEITAHTRSHACDNDRLNPKTLTYELLGGKVDLEMHGIYIENFVAPCGFITSDTTEAVKRYYVSQRTSEYGINPVYIDNPYLIKAMVINKTTSVNQVRDSLLDAKTKKGWLAIVFHQIDDTDEFYSIPVNKFIGFIDEIEKSNLQFALPIQVLSLKK